MSKKKNKDVVFSNKYWEKEKGDTVKFGNFFMRSFDEAGKLQFGKWFQNNIGEEVFQVKFVLDRNSLIESDEGIDFLKDVIGEWEEMMDE